MNKIEDAWERIFSEHRIVEQIETTGRFDITSAEINKIKESRLMTKFDHRASLPEIFKKNKLSILPVTRGSYIIGDFLAYHDQPFNQSIEAQSVEFPSTIETLRPENIFSESAAINCAFLSGMLDQIAGGPCLPTVSGRMGTSDFEFTIKRTGGGNHRIRAVNCQCEIDGGFESDGALILIEAKNAITEDFIVRQLFYPYRLWLGRTNKKVTPVFLCYSNDIFHFFEYGFEDSSDYNSIRLIKQWNFALAPERIELEDILAVLDSVQTVPEPNAPFPQADNFERVVDLVSIVGGGMMDRASITFNYGFDPRQTLYYLAAAKYLGLLAGSAGYFSLTKLGMQLLRMKFKEKYLGFTRAILSHRVFKEVCSEYFSNGTRPSIDRIVEIMKASGLNRVESATTYRRRARTVQGWIEWIIRLQS